MEQIRLRIRLLLKEKGYTPNKLAGGDSAFQNRLSRQLRSAVITADTLVSLLKAFPDISAEWLLLGEGEMIKQPIGKTINITKQGGNGAGQVNIAGDNNTLSKDEAVKMLLQQQQQLINAILEDK